MTRVMDIGGRYFEAPEQTSARQDGWLMLRVAEAGLDRFAGQDISDEATARELVLQCLRSGKKWELLAGLVVEAGEKFSEAKAAELTEFFAELTDPVGKATLETLFVSLLAGFFGRGGGSSTPSPSVSEGTKAGGRPRGRRSTAAATAG